MTKFAEEVDQADLWMIMLRTGFVEITFTKANGDVRVMRATLMKDHLPEQMDSSEQTPRNTSTIRCFDMDKLEWRSFRLDTVISFREI